MKHMGANQYGKLYLVFADDIISSPVVVADSDNFSFKIPQKLVSNIPLANKILAEFSVDGVKKTFETEAVSLEGNLLTLKALKISETFGSSSYLNVDYKGDFTLACVTEENESKLIRLANNINSAERNDLAKKIREIILSGTDDADVLNILAGINAKLDRILAILVPPVDVPNSFQARGVSISGGGVVFCYEGNILADKVFITSNIEGAGISVKFAGICRVSKMLGNIWQADFVEIDETSRDEIVRFVFAKEREILKEARF